MTIDKTDVMLDLETLGVSPGCIILSIAAVPFNCKYEIDPFYEKISASSCMEYGLVGDPITVKWWEAQDDAVRTEAFSGTKDVKTVLAEFALYLSALPGKPKIWGNGSDFDNAILKVAYNKTDSRLPWSYKDDRCFRTMKAEFSFLPYIGPVVKHNALHDATAQAVHMDKIYNWLHLKGALA